MQILRSISKFLMLAMLSSIVLTAWYGNKLTNAVSWDPIDIPIHTIPMASNVIPGDSVWSSISREFKLDHKAQFAEVRAEIRKLLADQDKLYRILQAAAPYIYFIHEQTQAYGLPAEIALIPIIESEFNPNDHSHKGATGLWQLMPATAHELGVHIESNYDGRRNVVASTNAALSYFSDLGSLFKGNWYLAIAAYNCGQNKVASVQRKTGSKSFWKLPLPRETRDYVPKLLAVAAIIQNPEKYGVELPPVDNIPVFTELKVKKAVNLKEVAKSSGIDVKTLDTLNPDYKHGMPKKGEKTLLVPVENESRVRSHLSGNIVNS